MSMAIRPTFGHWYWYVCCDVLVSSYEGAPGLCWFCGKNLGQSLSACDSQEEGYTTAVKAVAWGVRMKFSHGPKGYI